MSCKIKFQTFVHVDDFPWLKSICKYFPKINNPACSHSPWKVKQVTQHTAQYVTFVIICHLPGANLLIVIHNLPKSSMNCTLLLPLFFLCKFWQISPISVFNWSEIQSTIDCDQILIWHGSYKFQYPTATMTAPNISPTKEYLWTK